MRLRTWMLVLCLAALPAVALAQGSVNGKWAGEAPGGRGPQQVTLTLKAEGGKLTGSMMGGRGGEIAIEEGTIANGMLKFKTKQMGRGGEITLNWSGTLKGDEIAFTRMADGGQGLPVEFTLKRQQ